MSKAARAFGRKARLPAVLTVGAAGWAVVSSLLVYPHCLSYFNGWPGGPDARGRTSGGQQHRLGPGPAVPAYWLKDNPAARPLGLAYFGYFDPRVAGIDFTLPPKGPTSPEEAAGPHADELGPRPGWYAVSVTPLRGYEYPVP